MNLADVVAYLVPGIQFPAQCEIVDFGEGAVINRWGHSSPQPTEEEIEAAAPFALIAAQRAAIKPVTRRQMLTALHRVGFLKTIKDAVKNSGDVELQIAFDDSLEFARNDAFLTGMAKALGKSDDEVDAIFALAAGL
jgi:hypothetical protein